MEESFPVKYLSKIGSLSWVKLNALLISLCVPVYWLNPDVIDPLFKSSFSCFNGVLDCKDWARTTTSYSIFAFGVYTSSIVAPIPTPAPVILDPNVPNPASDEVATVPQSRS